MLTRIVSMILRILIYFFIFTGATLLLSRLIASFYAASRVYNEKNAPVVKAAVVFGAGLWRDGSPTPVLRDRVAMAATLFFNKKVQKLLLSGDNRFVEYNEPEAMRQYALQLGVPDTAIVLDYAGRRTYDTCYRAKKIFGLKEAILVTQKFHLPRALFTCNLLGLPAVGVPSDMRDYRRSTLIFWHFREVPATLSAFWQVLVTKPVPVLGKFEPIFPEDYYGSQ